jgi:hypothetical protein
MIHSAPGLRMKLQTRAQPLIVSVAKETGGHHGIKLAD